MALTKMTDDLNIIKKLDNEPNDVGGLTPEVLKSTFDKGPNKIKNYINDTLIPETEDKFEELEGEGRTIETIKKNADNIDKNKKDIDDLQANKADKKTTYTKLEIDGLNSDLQHYIENNENNISKLNNDKADKSNTYTKKEIDDKDTTLQGKIKSNEDNISSLCDGKADKSNTYTKGEVDSKNQYLQDKIGKNITDITSLKNNKADKSKVNQNSTNISNHIKSSSAHTANKISYSGKVPNTNNVSGALDSLQEDVNNFASGGTIEEVIHSRKDVDGHTHKNLKTHLDTWESKIKDNEKNLNESKEFRLNPTNSNASVISYPDNTKGLFNPEVKGVEPLFNYADNGVDYGNWILTGSGTTKSENGIHFVADNGFDLARLHCDVNINTKYTMVYYVSNSTISGNWLTRSDGIFGQSFSLEKTTGIHKLIFTTSNTPLYEANFFIASTNNNNGEYIDFKIYGIYEGNQTNDSNIMIERPYGLIEPALSYDLMSRGKNLFNKNDINLKTYIEVSTGKVMSHDTFCSSNCIVIQPRTQYYFERTAQGAFYDKEKNFISGSGFTQSMVPITSPDNAKYCRISTYEINLDIFQFEEGDIVTLYEPYISTKTGFSSPRPLLCIGNIKDEINNNKKLIYRNSGAIVLDGTQHTSFSSKAPDGDSVRVYVDNAKSATGYETQSAILNDPRYSWSEISTHAGYNFNMYGGLLYLSLRFDDTPWDNSHIPTTSEIQSYFKSLHDNGNPLIVRYQLENPEVINDGEQGFKSPSPLPAYQNGDLVQIPTSIREVDLNNTKNIIMKDKCIEILELINSDGNPIKGNLGNDGITVTLENNHTGIVYCKCRRDPSTCLNIIPNGLIPGNVNKRVEQNTLGITDLNKDFDKEEKINDMVLLEHELAIGEQGTRLDNAENKVNKHEKQLINMNHTIENQINNTIPEIRTKNAAIRIETRTSDPSNPEIGRIWLRTDL